MGGIEVCEWWGRGAVGEFGHGGGGIFVRKYRSEHVKAGSGKQSMVKKRWFVVLLVKRSGDKNSE